MKSDLRTYLDYPFVGVGVVVWRAGKFLLIQRGKPPRMGDWSIPGGRQELGETLEETAVREVAEETGVDIRVIGLIDVVDSIRRDESGDIEFHASLIDYAAIWINGEAAASSDASDVSWYDLADLPGLKLWTETERIILKSAKILKDYAEKSA